MNNAKCFPPILYITCTTIMFYNNFFCITFINDLSLMNFEQSVLGELLKYTFFGLI